MFVKQSAPGVNLLALRDDIKRLAGLLLVDMVYVARPQMAWEMRNDENGSRVPKTRLFASRKASEGRLFYPTTNRELMD